MHCEQVQMVLTIPLLVKEQATPIQAAAPMFHSVLEVCILIFPAREIQPLEIQQASPVKEIITPF